MPRLHQQDLAFCSGTGGSLPSGNMVLQAKIWKHCIKHDASFLKTQKRHAHFSKLALPLRRVVSPLECDSSCYRGLPARIPVDFRKCTHRRDFSVPPHMHFEFGRVFPRVKLFGSLRDQSCSLPMLNEDVDCITQARMEICRFPIP